MWKRRPVVASRVGGIQDQIEHGTSGWLLDDPSDLRACGQAIAALLDDGDGARALGEAAHDRVCERFLPGNHVASELAAIDRLAVLA
jgi:trehalose synthase